MSLTVNSDLLDKVRAAGINASRVAEEALATSLRVQYQERLRAEFRQDSEALVNYVAEHGDPAAELRSLFGGADAT